MKAKVRVCLFVLCVSTCLWGGCQQSQGDAQPMACAHAHNDYEHPRPLFDALDNGFTSVEADVHLFQNQLMVAHKEDEIRSGRTLQSLYLDPLRKRIQKNRGFVYLNGGNFRLLIDIKTDALETYQHLHGVLEEYKDILSHTLNGQPVPGPVQAIISGNRPLKWMKNQKNRYADFEGRGKDLDSADPVDFMPWISDNFNKITEWTGEGQMPLDDQKKLESFLRRAHKQGRIVRFWATPDKPAVWDVLLAEGVDTINVDHLEKFRLYMDAKQKK
jgi:hypothetical protein